MRIVHCFRSPVGGLFRHVRDLVTAQAAAGHAVGILCDSSTGGAYEDALFAELAPSLALGVKRTPMSRQIGLSDVAVAWRLLKDIRSLAPEVLHAHGAKGGAYARLIGTLLRLSGRKVAGIYTPHGGSLHYDTGTAGGRAYFLAERVLGAMTDAFVFVSRYEADAYADKVGLTTKPVVLARNGLRPDELVAIQPAADARDFLYIGMLRDLKGPDVFIAALAEIRARTGSTPTAWIVGSGDDKPRYQAMVAGLGLADAVAFRDPMPARQAFALAQTVVVPSRAESLPYIALEAIGAGVPLVATRVGGIPEIFGEDSDALVPPGDAAALAAAMVAEAAGGEAAEARRQRLAARVRTEFSVTTMAASVEAAYRAAAG